MGFPTGMAAMPSTGPCRALPARRLLACLALFLFGLRVLMPPGFMPDPAALRAGHFDITFCTAAGAVNLPVDLSDHHGKSGTPATGMADCPFGLAGTHSFMPAMPLPLALLHGFVGSVLHRVYSQVLPSLPAQGPPLGSRAPPASLL